MPSYVAGGLGLFFINLKKRRIFFLLFKRDLRSIGAAVGGGLVKGQGAVWLIRVRCGS
jgi:hypothetical protein